MDARQKLRIGRLTLFFFIAMFFMTGVYLMNVASVFSLGYFVAATFIIFPGLLVFISRPAKPLKSKTK